MSEKYGNPCAIYNIPLNISENDIFRIGRAHLQHFIQVNVKTDNCKPMMLKMHLELDDHPPSSIGEAEERNIEHNSSINGLRQSVQQHEEEIKALKDALLQAKADDEVNPNNDLRQSFQQLELEMKALKHDLLQAKEDDVVNRIDKAPDIDNNATQESNSNKQASNENKLSGEHNDTENVASASEGHHTNTKPEEKPEVIDLGRNCVYIENVQCSDSDPSLEKAFYNIRKLANDMNVKIPDDSIINIDVKGKPKNRLDYYVHFCNADIKKEFLKNRHFLKYHPETSPLRIFDYNEWGIVKIKDFRSSDLSLKTAYGNVIGIGVKMGITIDSDEIDHIDVFSTIPNFLTYSVQFTTEYKRKEFVKRKYLLKQFPETKSLKILDAGGHRLRFIEVDEVSMTVACANVIGLAELIGLSLAPDNLKRIYVPYYVDSSELSFVVEFSSKQVKDEFLKRKHNLENLTYFYSDIEILDINAKNNIVSIKYSYDDVATAISFIGLAKQLGFSLTPDQIQHFFDLSKFIDDAYTSRSEED